MSTFLNKKTNQHQTLHLDPQRLGQSHYIKEIYDDISLYNTILNFETF